MLSHEYYNLSSENYKSWRDDCVSGEWVVDWTVACLANLELGLRWLNDRIEEDNQAAFFDTIKDTIPNIFNGVMTGIAHGLVLDAQQKLADEFKNDPTTMGKLRKRARELTKRRKKNIP